MKFKKTKKMALVLSLSLGLTVPVWAAESVEIKSKEDRTLETGANVSASVEGFTSQGVHPDGTSFEITVEALAGMNASERADAKAYGIVNPRRSTITIGDNTIIVTATGGVVKNSSNSYPSYAEAYAYGIENKGTLTTGANTITAIATGGIVENSSNAANADAVAVGINHYFDVLTTGDNTITITALGGSAKSGSATAEASAYAEGIINVGGGFLTTENNTIVVTATGGTAESNSGRAAVYSSAFGISNEGILITGDNTITVTATGGIIESSSGSAFAAVYDEAYGIVNVSTMTTKANTIIVTVKGGTIENHSDYGPAVTMAVGINSRGGATLTATGSQSIYVESVAWTVNGVTEEARAYALLAGYVGTIILDSQGEAVQLTGDIAVNGIGAITVSLDNSNSYWRPRFQDTYEKAVNGGFGDGSFTIQDGGVLDLAWHANQGGYNFKDSQLTLTGDTIWIDDGATFIINADLANDVADTISADTTATGTHYVQVAYDPSYLTYDSVEGRALVLEFDGANGQGVASKMETPIRNVTLMPTIDGGYLVHLTFTSEASEGGKTASDSYQQQINILRAQWSTLIQRLGDVRNENPDSHNGSWARTYGGKLKSDGVYGRKSTMKYGGVQAGYDRMRETGSGKYLAGFLVDYLNADSDFQRGSGSTESLAFGGYWTWLSPKGHYADVVVKATHLDTDYDFYYLSGEKTSADLTNWGYTMSVEYGYRYDLKKNRYIEPQAQFLVGHLQSKNYRSSNEVSLHQDGVNLAMGRLGVLFGWTDENKSSAYIRGSLVHDFSGSGALTSSYEGDRMRIDTAGNVGTSFEVNVGANVILGKNSHLYAELTKGFGGDVKTDWQANIGWRVKW